MMKSPIELATQNAYEIGLEEGYEEGMRAPGLPDLLTRLRAAAGGPLAPLNRETMNRWRIHMRDAADEIERLNAALKGFIEKVHAIEACKR